MPKTKKITEENPATEEVKKDGVEVVEDNKDEQIDPPITDDESKPDPLDSDSDIIVIDTIEEPKKKEETVDERQFRLTISSVEKVLQEDLFKKDYRLKLVKDGKAYHIMQGSQVWGSLRLHRISIFRGTLKRLLKDNTLTKRYFKNVE